MEPRGPELRVKTHERHGLGSMVQGPASTSATSSVMLVVKQFVRGMRPPPAGDLGLGSGTGRGRLQSIRNHCYLVGRVIPCDL